MNGGLEFGGEAMVGTTPSPHLTAVERVITAMRRFEDGVLCLRTMAEIANLSPYHFARTFRSITGIPPGEFLTAVRLERAKHLLLSTEIGVSEACFEVGYESVGTFTTRFKNLVGLPPGKMRRLPEDLHEALVRAGGEARSSASREAKAGITFRVHGPDLAGSMIFAGLFSTAIPQGRPVAGTVLSAPGRYKLRPVADGHYHLMAATLPNSEDPWELLLPGDSLRVGRAHHPVVVGSGRADAVADVALRPTQSTDPPVLVALPALLLERLRSP